MGIKKLNNGSYQVDVRTDGHNGKRIRKNFKTRAEAQRYETYIRHKIQSGEPWQESVDNRRLSELIALWYQQHGQFLSDGQNRLRLLNIACEAMGNPKAAALTPNLFLKHRDQRIKQGIAPKSLNNLHTYINAMYNELEHTETIDYPSPLAKVRKIKIKERELTYLDDDQIKELLGVIKGRCKSNNVYLMTLICLSTGCRWGEAQKLNSRHVKNCAITFTNTKSGKNRTIPIHPKLFDFIQQHGKGDLFSNGKEAFRRCVALCSFDLPAGQSTHILRHTYASHYIMRGGNILTLQRILGHSTANMTMRYAHLAPDHLQTAVTFNPMGHFWDTF